MCDDEAGCCIYKRKNKEYKEKTMSIKRKKIEVGSLVKLNLVSHDRYCCSNCTGKVSIVVSDPAGNPRHKKISILRSCGAVSNIYKSDLICLARACR